MRLWRKPFDAQEKATIPGKILLDEDRCKGCSFCVEFCPRDVLKTGQEINSKGYTLVVVEDENKCLNCGFCEVICPEFAIHVVPRDNPD
jgi:2-oxoglutarate ferredoxin oxidoreductase subunit delta